MSEVEAVIKTLFHVCSCPSLAFGLPPHPYGWSPTRPHGCPTCFLCRITTALAADREKQPYNHPTLNAMHAIDLDCAKAYVECGPSQAQTEEDAGRQPINKLSSSAQELKVGDKVLLRGKVMEIVEPGNRGIGIKVWVRRRTSLRLWVDANVLAREAHIRRDALRK